MTIIAFVVLVHCPQLTAKSPVPTNKIYSTGSVVQVMTIGIFVECTSIDH